MQRAHQRDRHSDGSEKKDGQQGNKKGKGEFGERESELTSTGGRLAAAAR